VADLWHECCCSRLSGGHVPRGDLLVPVLRSADLRSER